MRLKADALMTGHSIPWLLKTAYLKNGISAPTLGPEMQKAVLRELSFIGRNVNQIAREVNSGLISHVKEALDEIVSCLRILKSFLGLEYGDRKNSV